MEAARRLGLDDTYIYMDEAEGWKLSRYIEDARTLDYHDEQQVTQALAMLRRLHESGEQTAYPFDAWGEIQGFEESLRRFNRADFEDMQQMRDGIAACAPISRRTARPCACATATATRRTSCSTGRTRCT